MRNSGLVDQQLLKTANRQKQNIHNVILLVENSEIMPWILHKFKPLNESETLKTVMSGSFFLVKFFTWPRNYYNDNKV